MCRVPTRIPQRAADEEQLQNAPSLLEALDALNDSEHIDSSEGDIDDEFLKMLNGCIQEEEMVETKQPAVAIDCTQQPLTMDGSQNQSMMPGMMMGQPALGMPHATMQQQPIYQQPPMMPPMYQYHMMQQAYMSQQQALTMSSDGTASRQDVPATYMNQQTLPDAPPAVPAAPTAPRQYKRNKTAEEVAVQEEMVKRRRRESAQRSRQRKAVYINSLELENKALKMENERLRMQLNKVMNPSSGNISGTTSAAALAPMVEETCFVPIPMPQHLMMM